MKSKNLIFSSVMMVLLQSSITLAYEVDNFTDRNVLKKDSLSILDKKINSILETAAKETRKEAGKYCNQAILRQEILRWIRPDPTGQLEVWMELSDEIDHTHVGISESIYKNLPFIKAPVLKTVGIGRSIILNGHIVGTDKIGHFFYQGLAYYDLVKEGKSLEKVLSEDHQEDGMWGLSTSGVYSYGDMAANYQGYRFWSELTKGDQPYFKCDENIGWKKARDFTWANYANDAWDEALNCSEMKPEIKKVFEKNMAEKGFTCPMVPEKCVEMTMLDHSRFFTSPKCQAASDRVIGSRMKRNRLASYKEAR